MMALNAVKQCEYVIENVGAGFVKANGAQNNCIPSFDFSLLSYS
jgi:hypothetical protein